MFIWFRNFRNTIFKLPVAFFYLFLEIDAKVKMTNVYTIKTTMTGHIHLARNKRNKIMLFFLLNTLNFSLFSKGLNLLIKASTKTINSVTSLSSIATWPPS